MQKVDIDGQVLKSQPYKNKNSKTVSSMATGKVKWFNNSKGYGFVCPDQGSEDLFVHYSYIQMEGYKSLKAGQEVEFDLLEAGKGFHATNLRLKEPTS